MLGVEAFEAVVSYWIEDAGEERLMTKVRVSNGLLCKPDEAEAKLAARSDKGLASATSFSAPIKRRLSSREVDSNT